MINIDDLVSELPLSRQLVITRRALEECGIPYVWHDDPEHPVLQVDEDASDLMMSDAFLDAWSRHASLMIAGDVVAAGIEAGVLEVDGANEDGELTYKLVDGVDISEWDEYDA